MQQQQQQQRERPSGESESGRTRMETVRLICETEVPLEQQKMDTFAASFAQSLDSIKSKAQETVHNRGKLWKLKSSLREAEDDYVNALAVKTRQEAKQMAIKDSISATRERIHQLKQTLQVQRARRDEHAAVVSQLSAESATSEEKRNQDVERKVEIQEAVSWYNRVLGLHIEGGHGVKFTFNNINLENPLEEYSFTIRHENDTYTLLACDPWLDSTKELINELNKTNGLFKFVRTMRVKFQEAASVGFSPQSADVYQESSIITASAPVLSVSTERSSSSVQTCSKKVKRGKGRTGTILSPQSVRHSPRILNKKIN